MTVSRDRTFTFDHVFGPSSKQASPNCLYSKVAVVIVTLRVTVCENMTVVVHLLPQATATIVYNTVTWMVTVRVTAATVVITIAKPWPVADAHEMLLVLLPDSLSTTVRVLEMPRGSVVSAVWKLLGCCHCPVATALKH